VLYLIVAAAIPSARDIFLSVHLHRGIVLAASTGLAVMLARQLVRRESNASGFDGHT